MPYSNCHALMLAVSRTDGPSSLNLIKLVWLITMIHAFAMLDIHHHF